MASTTAPEYAVEVNDVSMVFNMASEQLNSLKEYFIKLMRHELFFSEFRALKHISFKVRPGEVVGLVGNSQRLRKSTMLKIIAGVLEASEGTCIVRGNIAPLIELGAGFDLELTARENIYLNGALLGDTKVHRQPSRRDRRVRRAARFHGHAAQELLQRHGRPHRLPITTIRADIPIVDETLSVGDVFFQEKCERRIQHFIDHPATSPCSSFRNRSSRSSASASAPCGSSAATCAWTAPCTRSARPIATSSPTGRPRFTRGSTGPGAPRAPGPFRTPKVTTSSTGPRQPWAILVCVNRYHMALPPVGAGKEDRPWLPKNGPSRL